MSIVELDSKHGIWKRFDNFPFNFNGFFFGQLVLLANRRNSTAGNFGYLTRQPCQLSSLMGVWELYGQRQQPACGLHYLGRLDRLGDIFIGAQGQGSFPVLVGAFSGDDNDRHIFVAGVVAHQ